MRTTKYALERVSFCLARTVGEKVITIVWINYANLIQKNAEFVAKHRRKMNLPVF